LGRGKLDSRIAINSRDELGTLADACNKMAEKLQRTTVSKTDLEARVEERTAELAQANETLRSDIAERKRIEEVLRKSEESYRDLFDNAQDAIYVHDLNGRYISINRAAEKLAGYSRDEVVGKNFADFMAPEYVERIRENLNTKLDGKRLTNYEIEVRAKDGQSVPVEVSTRLIYENGIAVAVQGMARDITERKRAEMERRVIAEIVQSAITTADLDALFKLAHQEKIGRASCRERVEGWG